jgi:hypothetical protein
MGRTAAILVALAIILVLEFWWRQPWYFAVPLSLLSYLVIRHGRYFLWSSRDENSN